jgi:hypothetical protein
MRCPQIESATDEYSHPPARSPAVLSANAERRIGAHCLARRTLQISDGAARGNAGLALRLVRRAPCDPDSTVCRAAHGMHRAACNAGSATCTARAPRLVPRRCGRGERSPGADVAAVSPVPVQMWAGRAQSSCRWLARSRCRCGSGEPQSRRRFGRAEPSPGADVAGVSPSRRRCGRRAASRWLSTGGCGAPAASAPIALGAHAGAQCFDAAGSAAAAAPLRRTCARLSRSAVCLEAAAPACLRVRVRVRVRLCLRVCACVYVCV